MYDVVWSPKYQFPMKPIALQAIEIATAQLRDVQDEITQLKLKAEWSISPIVLRLEATDPAAPNTRLLWTPTSELESASEAFDVKVGGVIRFLREGTYLVTVTVEHNPNVNRVRKKHTIQRDGAEILTYRGWSGGSGCSSLVLTMAAKQTLSVINTSEYITEAGSSMFIVLLM